jgi:hypothetical protein
MDALAGDPTRSPRLKQPLIFQGLTIAEKKDATGLLPDEEIEFIGWTSKNTTMAIAKNRDATHQ